ncbi:MAG: hypothetical protein KAU48_04775 [Candidatus Thorarchaeota archaeon]|nr:hypothetical protein [Candidatus Thorarchaeota archaeon]
MNDVYRPSEVQKATILLIFAGALEIYLGLQTLQFSLIIPNPILMIVGTFMPVFGLFTLCASLIVWLQKPWATKIIAGIGIAVFMTLVLFGYYLISIILFAPIYWITINWIRTSKPTEIPDWAPDWNED